jgi:hypothetical protein
MPSVAERTVRGDPLPRRLPPASGGFSAHSESTTFKQLQPLGTSAWVSVSYDDVVSGAIDDGEHLRPFLLR